MFVFLQLPVPVLVNDVSDPDDLAQPQLQLVLQLLDEGLGTHTRPGDRHSDGATNRGPGAPAGAAAHATPPGAGRCSAAHGLEQVAEARAVARVVDARAGVGFPAPGEGEEEDEEEGEDKDKQLAEEKAPSRGVAGLLSAGLADNAGAVPVAVPHVAGCRSRVAVPSVTGRGSQFHMSQVMGRGLQVAGTGTGN
mgnify:CR=1 FL=1